MKRSLMQRQLLIALAVAAWAGVVSQGAGAEEKKIGYKDTPMLPGGKWHVHDSDRPQPQAIEPGTPSTLEAPGKPPSDAIILFDGTDLSKWRTAQGEVPGWTVENGCAVVPPHGTKAGSDIYSKEEFGDCQVHVEWATPKPPQGDIMNRGNSGVFLFGKFEVQVFESYHAGIYADGQAAAIYGQYPPLVNACRQPGAWQMYDIAFTAPRFKDGKLVAPAYTTVFLNGVCVHNHVAIMGSTGHRILPAYTPQGAKGPLMLQAHGNPVRFRNVWVRELKDYDQP
jgi:hypothetical protein